MKAPRLLALATLFALALVGRSHAQYTDLLSLTAPPEFGASVEATYFSGTGSQGVTGIVVNGSIIFGDEIFAGIGASQDWSALFTPGSYFAIFMTTASPNPDAAMSLEFLDSSDISIDVWTGFSGASAVNGYVNFDTLGSAGTGDYSDVGSFYITWGNASAATIDTTMSKIAVVPEPSTYALLALSGLALGGHIIRRRHRV